MDIGLPLNKFQAGAGGEFQLTDTNGKLLDSCAVEAYRKVDKSHD